MPKEQTPHSEILDQLQLFANYRKQLPTPREIPIIATDQTPIKIMSVEEIERRRITLDERIETGYSEFSQMSRILGKVSSHKARLNLGQHEKEVNWSDMPDIMSNVFRPLFKDHPSTISHFFLSFSNIEGDYANMAVELRKDRETLALINSSLIITKATGELNGAYIRATFDPHHPPRNSNSLKAIDDINSLPDHPYGNDSNALELFRGAQAIEMMDKIFLFILKEMQRRYGQTTIS